MSSLIRKRVDCRGCHSTSLQPIINYGLMPLAGSFLDPKRVDKERLFPLTLVRCGDCTLMQVPEVVDPTIIFAEYSYASSTTQSLIRHFAEMARDIVNFGVQVNDLVVEMGCNDGVLIRPLRDLCVNAVGVDPSDVARRASEAEGWPLVSGYLDQTAAATILEKYGRAKIVVANNVFAHIDNVNEALSAVSAILRNDGLFVFEVQYQGDLIRDHQFDTVYHEHLCYYSLRSLVELLRPLEFDVVDVCSIPIHSGSIRVVAAPKTSKRTASDNVEQFLQAEKSWNIGRFIDGVLARRTAIHDEIRERRSSGQSVVAYGASGRSTVLLNYCKLDTTLIDYVVDMSPLRYGRLISGVRVPVHPEEVFRRRYPDYAMMTAWNYEPEIVRKERGFLESGGRFIIPLPHLRIVSAK